MHVACVTTTTAVSTSAYVGGSPGLNSGLPVNSVSHHGSDPLSLGMALAGLLICALAESADGTRISPDIRLRGLGREVTVRNVISLVD